MFNAMGNYKITAVYSLLAEKILRIFSIPEIKLIPTVYFFHPIFLHLISFILILSIKVKKKTEDKIFFHLCLILPMLMYIDGIFFNIIISNTIFHSYLPTVYAPRAIISMLLIFIVYLIIFSEEDFYKIFLILLVSSLVHASQNFLILITFLPYFMIRIYLNNLKAKEIIFLFFLYYLNFYLLDLDNILSNEVINSNLLFDSQYLKVYFFSLFIFLILCCKNYLFFSKYKFHLSKIILLISFEILLIFFYILQKYSLKIFTNEIGMIAHSYQQIYDRYFGMVIGAVILLNFYYIIKIISFKKKIFYLKIIIIFIIIFCSFNYKKTILVPKILVNNLLQTFKNFKDYDKELETYFKSPDKYVMEENFNEKKTYYNFNFLKKGNAMKIVRPDINDPDFWLALYFHLSSKKL